MRFYESSVVYDRQTDNGIKTVKEQYVTKSETCKEAEERLVEEVTPFVWDTVPEVCSIKWADFSEVLSSTGEGDDTYWKIKVNYITLDERTHKEKKAKDCYLVQAATAIKAKMSLDEHLATSTTDYRIVSIAETGILDVFE